MIMTDQSKRFPSIHPHLDPGPVLDPGHCNDPAPDDPAPHGPDSEIPVQRNRQAQRIMGCRRIDGDLDRPDWRYCQKPRLAKRSYCSEHHARSINLLGDNRYTAEAAECDLYLQDLPPPEDEANGIIGFARQDGTSDERDGE